MTKNESTQRVIKWRLRTGRVQYNRSVMAEWVPELDKKLEELRNDYRANKEKNQGTGTVSSSES